MESELGLKLYNFPQLKLTAIKLRNLDAWSKTALAVLKGNSGYQL